MEAFIDCRRRGVSLNWATTFGVVCALLFAGCANPEKGARIGLAVLARAQKEAAEAFPGWDRQHQLELVAAAASKAEGAEALASYREARRPGVIGLQSLYLGIIGAEKTIAMSEMGKAKKLNLFAVVENLFSLYESAARTLRDLGAPIGGVSWER